jgi:hypothetical protein
MIQGVTDVNRRRYGVGEDEDQYAGEELSAQEAKGGANEPVLRV